jgi:hypothetical protein
MKMKQADFKDLEQRINCRLFLFEELYREYMQKNLSEMRWRWDFFFDSVETKLALRLYNYLNINQIDTALRKITATE